MLIACRVFLPFACAYFISYAFRSINAIIAPDLVRDLGLSAADLGLLTSAYLLVFGAVQIPLGIALDRWGPRRTNAILLLFAATGAALFAFGHDIVTLTIGRGLIGMGVAACLMAAFKAYIQWFPPERWTLVNGLHMAVGGIGAVAASGPVEYFLTLTDWRGLFWGTAGLTVVIAGALIVVVPKRTTVNPDSRLIDALKGVGQVFSDRAFWCFAPLAALVQGTLIAMQGLWAGPWLRDVAGFDRPSVGATLTAMALSLTLGFVVSGVAADRLARLGVKPTTVGATGMGLFLLVQATIIVIGADFAAITWPLFNFLGTFGTLSYAVLSRRFPQHLAGRVNTGINVLVFGIAFGIQWGVGAVLGLWPTSATGYAPEAYRVAFSLVLAAEVATALWFAVSARWAGFYASTSKTLAR